MTAAGKKTRSDPAPKSSAERVREHRARKRAEGLKLVQFWVPDVSSPEFKAEARRQSLLVARSARADEDQEFIDSITLKWWEEP